MGPGRKDDLTDRVCSHREYPSCDQYSKMSQTRRCKTIAKTDLVNSERLWQILLGHRRSPSHVFFAKRVWQERRLFAKYSSVISDY
jgi:hypothetical protein